MSQNEQGFDWIYADEINERIDKFLAQQKDSWSRSQIQLWVKEGRVQVNRKFVKPNYKLQKGDYIFVNMPPSDSLTINPEPMDLDIIYEDQDVIVVNKRRGMVVHPAPGHDSGTLVNGLLAHCQHLSKVNGLLRPGIVHRIDKDTSGLLMIAKNDRAHDSLAEQLKKHSVIRFYMAITHGSTVPDSGTIDAPIARDPHNRKRMAVVGKGKPAITHFSVMERWNGYSLLKLRLETGRTHQIRVHMKYINHPIVGDPVYGSGLHGLIDGQALHAQTLGFAHPRTGKQLEFNAPLPQDMIHLVETLREVNEP